MKKSQNSSPHGFYLFFAWNDREPELDPDLDPDPGGPSDHADPDPEHYGPRTFHNIRADLWYRGLLHFNKKCPYSRPPYQTPNTVHLI